MKFPMPPRNYDRDKQTGWLVVVLVSVSGGDHRVLAKKTGLSIAVQIRHAMRQTKAKVKLTALFNKA